MARKVFISFLGTNNYIQTRYSLDGEKSKVVRFVQEAIIDLLCGNWTADDSIVVFFTKEAKKRNWLDNGHQSISNDIEKIGLESILKEKNLMMKLETCEIEEGFSEKEIWSIFNKVYDMLNEGDEIYFDVTHAFRSIPLFSMVLFNFARSIKGTEVMSILYGAFEKLGSVRHVKENIPNPEDRVAPLIDITSLVYLQTINNAANSFIEFGKVGGITELLEEKKINSWGAMRTLYTLRTQLTNLENYIQTCKMEDIKNGKYMKEINDSYAQVINSESLNDPEKRLLKEMIKNLNGFKPKKTTENIKAAIDWALKYDMLQQAYTLGREFIVEESARVIRKICRENGWDIDNCVNESSIAIFVSGIVAMDENDRYIDSIKDSTERRNRRIELAEKLLKCDFVRELHTVYKPMRVNRNSLNHAGGYKKTKEDLEKEFKLSYEKSMDIINTYKD